ncbi:peptide-methionine (S)-S-oxide reductase [Oceanimonas sp. CHS3-5]|uniref:peptide-methionine (S)-S-oxide reductase n=1 Tax=Oceanimonas sp. CHS3-5 TaxID=3068186 RepID=UPI00273F013E|nr:peptide-methionine (S)-S-oxide reductase [Oceanimonas sp. CHS3-5]MDP5291345.1 peptide-methionine (S)-S-oxide reductase [Oceanimonas sp. CHS3-5]
MIRLLMLTALLLPVVPALAGQAVFAGGSFWVMEALFDGRPGIEKVEPGWMQGESRLQRRQVVRVHYRDDILTYGDLLRLYWQAVDAHDAGGQHCDRGIEFSPALFVDGPLQLKWARQSRSRLRLERGRRLDVRIFSVSRFVPAAARHQQYYRRHGLLYYAYRRVCGYPDGSRFSLQPLLAEAD